jgi:hypothetical protein
MPDSFPLISDLPGVTDTHGWAWTRFEHPWKGTDHIWVGTDHDGNRWLLKMRGSFRAYREIVFARIAQTLGWSNQSSVFALVPKDAEPRKAVRESEGIQAVSWFLPEHGHGACGTGCPMEHLARTMAANSDDSLEAISHVPIRNMLDGPRSEIAALLFGSNDGPEALFTPDHRLVIIDSEQMFSISPTDLTKSGWWRTRSGEMSKQGIDLTTDVCKAVTGLGLCTKSAGWKTVSPSFLPNQLGLQPMWPRRTPKGAAFC